MKTRALVIVAIVSLSTACGATSGDTDAAAVDLIALTRAIGTMNVHVPVTGSSAPVVTRAALPLTIPEGDGARTLTTPSFEIPRNARIAFSYSVDPPVLGRAPVRIRARLLDDESNVAAERAWKVRRSVMRNAWLGLRSRWAFRDLPVDHSKSFVWDVSEYAGKTMRVEFRVQAERPADELVARYERQVGRAMQSPFALVAPRVFGDIAAPIPGDRPDIVLVFADGLRRDLTEGEWCARHAPTLWRLSVSGMTVERALAPSNTARSSMAAMLAGRPASVIGLPLGNRPVSPDELRAHLALTADGAIPGASADSLPRLLQRNGYRTIYLGEDPFRENDPFAASFDEAVFFARPEVSADQIDAWLRSRLRRRDGPTLIVVHLGGIRRTWNELVERRAIEPIMPAGDPRDRLAPAVSRVDATIGRIVRHFENNHRDAPAVFAIAGTHGISWESGHPLGHGHALYDGEIRVALLVRRPGFVPVGPVAGPRSTIDLHATLAQLAGVRVPDGIESRSLLSPVSVPTEIVAEAPGQFAAIRGGTKFIARDEPYGGVMVGRATDDGHFEELYALEADERENRNLIGDAAISQGERAIAWNARKGLRVARRTQIRELRRAGFPVDSIYPDRAFERFHVNFHAAQKPVRFQGVIRCENGIYTYRRIGTTDEGAFRISSNRTNLYFDIDVPAGRTRQIGFTPWPAVAPFELEFFANGERLPESAVRFGPLGLPIYGNPARLAGERDLTVLTANDPPPTDHSLEFVDVWATPIVRQDDSRRKDDLTWMTDIVEMP
ncbi:MAG: sulfatase-like hydrolase/transferase [Deltaproteobacteria bacterium]|nr:sulfatase-like hydrolase/transferase [Deltaproteobacteria bacterium]